MCPAWARGSGHLLDWPGADLLAQDNQRFIYWRLGRYRGTLSEFIGRGLFLVRCRRAREKMSRFRSYCPRNSPRLLHPLRRHSGELGVVGYQRDESRRHVAGRRVLVHATRVAGNPSLFDGPHEVAEDDTDGSILDLETRALRFH